MEQRSGRAPSVVDLGRWIEEVQREEDEISFRRRLLQGRLDILRAERAARELSGHVSVDRLADILTGSAQGREHFDELDLGDDLPDPLGPFPDVNALPQEELARMIRDLERGEAWTSNRRRLLHERIDFLLIEQARSKRRT
jgi:hypothetical protein